MPYIKYVNPVRFVQTATVTVASTAVETTLVGAGEGSLSLTKNSTLVGKTFKVKGFGIFSNTGTPTLRIKVKLGSVVVLDSTAVTTTTAATNREFEFEGVITVRTVGSSGTAFAQGKLVEYASTAVLFPMANTSTVAVDTTANLAFDVTAQWGTSSSSNTISLTNLTIEEVN